MNQEYAYGPKVMVRNGKIVFSDEASQYLGLTKNSRIKIMTDATSSCYYLVITSSENNESFKIRKAERFCYITCADLLKTLGLYSPHPTIYELIKVDREHDELTSMLVKIITVTNPKIGMLFPNKEELRTVIAMLNFNI